MGLVAIVHEVVVEVEFEVLGIVAFMGTEEESKAGVVAEIEAFVEGVAWGVGVLEVLEVKTEMEEGSGGLTLGS